MCRIIKKYEDKEGSEILNDSLKEDCFDVLYELLKLASKYGFCGNLWHFYITHLIVNHENPYSLSSEIKGEPKGSLNNIALGDFGILKAFFDYPVYDIFEKCGIDFACMISDYIPSEPTCMGYNASIRDKITKLCLELEKAKNAKEFKDIITEFYAGYGVGEMGLNRAFRINFSEDVTDIVPIVNVTDVDFDDLYGYESAKAKLMENTERFVDGKTANNCLLYGDAGTGKSTSIKALMNRYYDRGLRVIEIYKHQFKALNHVISRIKNRNYKFIIFMDDLSFEDFETEYKYLKAVIEGGLENKPQNVLIYATSNRRHLIKESFKDKEDRDEELHRGDTVQEKLSLSSRFGLQIFYGRPDKKDYDRIVLSLAEKYSLKMDEEELLQKANQWEISHGGKTPRAAMQLINSLK